ncbi:MAG: tetratricopeptide repeat protein [Deltaproteobacteria bacterium]|nr:tetratricopeptide repeat protein [Deltaproteobacteria bacterium]
MACLAMACASGAPVEPEPAPLSTLPPASPSTLPPASPSTPPSELARSLESLAASALEQGDLAGAENRYSRLLVAHPSSVMARLGLAAVARRRGDTAGERRWLEAALAQAPHDGDALAAMAALHGEVGESQEARRLLARALEARPRDPKIHAALLRLTGLAPRSARPASLEEALALADAHPYDPWAQLRAGRALLAAGERERARLRLWQGVRYADLDPRSALAGMELLRELDPDFALRRVVPVHSYADQTLSRHPDWKMRLRLLWDGTSGSLDPVLSTVFVPVSFAIFSSRESGDDLGSIDAAWQRRAKRWPAAGLLAGFTERPLPQYGGFHRRGQAQLLGRRLLVRIDSDALESRVLIHELLHIYGAVHVAEGMVSIMNPGGESLVLDPVNQQIVAMVRDRRFAAGRVDRDVLPYIDAETLTKVYVASLRVNLKLRSEGIEDAEEAAQESRFIAYEKAREAVALDPQLADVASLVADLFAYQERYAQAAMYQDMVAELVGPQSRRGRRARSAAEALRRRSAALYGGSEGGSEGGSVGGSAGGGGTQ